MGTSITDKQMTLVQRYTHNVVLMLDADNAGSEATLRGVEVAAGAAERGLTPTVDWRGLVSYQDVLKADIRVIALPDGEDPDSLVRSDPDRLRALLKDAKPVADHLFDAVDAVTDFNDPRARSRALEVLAPTVAAVADPVVRAHYVQKMARLAQIDERSVLALLNRGRAPRPAAVPSARELSQAAHGSASVPDGETQLLQLLMLRSEARPQGRILDPDTFEDSTNRLLFEAWRELGDLDEHLDELDDDVRERLAAVRASAKGIWDPSALESNHIEGRVSQIAERLRLRRAQARLLPAAVAVASDLATSRRTGAAEDATGLAAEFEAMDARQRALSRRARGQPVGVDDDT
jgi:DNA primase